jgi:hypothetical protein
MHSASKTWPPRLLATAVALALVVAYVVSAYAHAAGHQPADPGHAAAVAAAGDHADRAFAAVATAPERDQARGQADGGHDEEPAGHSLDCYDTICHGGQAILAAVPVIAASVLAAPFMGPTAALHGTDPGGLDRPPKPFRSA